MEMRMRIVTIGLTMIFIACNCHAAADDSTEPQLYTVKQTYPSVGTNIRRPIILAGAIPLSAHYGELSPEQKNILRSRYVQMKETDEPPFPADGLLPIFMVVREAHEQSGLENTGRLEVLVQVDDHGKAIDFTVLRTPDTEIAKAVTTALMARTYKPAVCDGSPCAMPFTFRAVLIAPGDDATRSLPSIHMTIPHF
jgi:hypothetical protein